MSEVAEQAVSASNRQSLNVSQGLIEVGVRLYVDYALE